MRVLMITSSYPKYPGEATAPFIEEIAANLAARGHTIYVAAPWHPDVRRSAVERGVHLHFFRYAPHPALNIWGYAQSLLSDTAVKRLTLAAAPFALAGTVRTLHTLIAQEHPTTALEHCPFDLVHAHWVLPNGPPAALVARQHGLPLVVSLHGSDVYLAEQHWSLATVAGLALREAMAVTACSVDLHRRSLRLGAPVASSHVIPYGVNPEAFRPDPDARRQVRGDLRLAADVPLVVALGRFVSKKGFDVLLDAWPHVLAEHPQAFLALVGYGDLHAQLEQQARRLGITERVCFTGQVAHQRAAAMIAAADVFALPIVSHQGADGLPNALLEAMGVGRPVVASRVAGVPDVIDDGVHGLLVPDRNPPALATAIVRLLNDRPLAERLGAAARQRIETELTWEQTAARFEQVYNAAVHHALEEEPR